ncbi:PD-(D/E)XK nuclease family protein [Schaalia sp. 19OD2882]|uniref:PD-(D/E)XK nuclease family protein n=1 Tax=Schaalia sp. 19OD2882 TaxID=2794089 RepID=UPI001C1EFA90|nr:PD-(D/E)XK nuclease family protein [Schaalia sp. 19OD2882]QWW20092.1 PD-(D/E)XK nuclease family protein [Schaalia sp. 19OD2882]
MSERRAGTLPDLHRAGRKVELDTAQSHAVELARDHDMVVRGAPGSGRTTCALATAREALARGGDVLVLVPDRVRADRLMPLVQEMAPDLVRPVRTPAAFAYHVVDTWRRVRTDPLGPLQLVTGARQEELLGRLLVTTDAPWPDSISPGLRALPAFRAQVRNLFARAGEAGIDGLELARLGAQLDIPVWQGAGHLLHEWEHGEGFDVTTRTSMQADLSRIQHLAATLLTHWQERADGAGVTAPPPLPHTVVVDDLQDCTASTVELLAACAGAGARVVAFSDPDVAVASYRGGQPHLDGRLAERLGVDIVDLGQVHRGGPLLRDLVRRTVSRIGQSGPAGRRTVGVHTPQAPQVGGVRTDTTPAADRASDTSAPPEEVRTHLAASAAQLGALTARLLRAHHLHEGIPWDQQAVIVRSASRVLETRRHLRRAGVPLAGRRQAHVFSAQPVTRVLLALLHEADQGEDPTVTTERAHMLLDSAYLDADSLDLQRALSTLNADRGVGVARPVGLVDLLEAPDLIEGLGDQDLREALTRAASMWRLGSEVAHSSPSQALWALWDAAGVAQSWREQAVKGGGDCDLFDDRLDAVLALFRVADVWEQRHLGGDALAFATDLLAETLPVDTLGAVGRRPPGVDVLTPAQAAGRQWEVVCVLGIQDGTWPDLRLRDRLLRTDILTDLVAGRLPQDQDGNVIVPEDARAARKAVLDDETRLFAAAISRSTRVLHLGAVLSEDQAPSPFLDLVPGFRGDALDDLQVDEVPPPLDLAGHVGALRHIAASEESGPRSERALTLLALLAREGVSAADPRTWTGAGGISSAEATCSTAEVVVSPSSFEKVRENPMAWFLSSIGASEAPGQAQTLGSLVHALAEAHPHGGGQRILAALEEHLPELDVDPDTENGRRVHEHAREVVAALASYLDATDSHAQVEVEVPFDVTVAGVRIRGRIDRLEKVGEGWRIIDFKTAKKGNKKSAVPVPDNPQLALYQLALTAMGRMCVGAELKYLGHGDVRTAVQMPLDPERTEYWIGELQAVADIMRGPTYAAIPSTDFRPRGGTDLIESLAVRSIE